MAKYTSQKGTVASFVSSANSGDLYVINSDSRGARINSKVALTSADQIAIDGFSTDYRIVVNSKGVVSLTNLATKTSSIKSITFTVANNADVKISFADGTLVLERDGAKGYNIGEARVTSRALRLENATVQNALDDNLVYDPVTGNLSDASTYTLTNNIDVATANVFNSTPVYTPGGNDFINSLQDEDRLTGTGVNPTLNLTLGSVNDNAEYTVTPLLNGIETVNISIVDESNNVSFQNVTGLKTLNVVRYTEENSDIYFYDLDKTVTTLSVKDAVRGTDVHFHYREDVLTATNDSVTLNLNNARTQEIHISTDSDDDDNDNGNDEGYFWENIVVNATGTNDIDQLDIQTNGREDWDAGRDADTTKMSLTINAGAAPGAQGSLEINDLELDSYISNAFDAADRGVDHLTIVANQRVDISRDKSLALKDSFYDGLESSDLETLTIRGAGNVRIDNVEGEVGNNDDQKGLTVNATQLTGNLRISIDGETSDDNLFVLNSGTGNDEIYMYGHLDGDINTGSGNDTVTAAGYDFEDYDQGDLRATASIITGAGNDTVVVDDLDAQGDTSEFQRDNAPSRAAFINTGDNNDTVTVGSLDSAINWDDNVIEGDDNSDDRYSIIGASVTTGSGNDILNIDEAMEENTLIDMGNNDDILNYDVSGFSTGVGALADDTNSSIEYVSVNPLTTEVDTSTLDLDGAVIDLGAGNDTITFTDDDTEDSDSLLLQATTDVNGAGAKLKGGLGNDTLIINTTDTLTVVSQATNANSAALITGIETIELNILNSIDFNSDFTGEDQNEDNDMDETDVYLDVKRVDTDLANIKMVSNEKPLQTGAGGELYESGNNTYFTINNLRTNIGLSLTAFDATGVYDGSGDATDNDDVVTGDLLDDTLLSIDSVTGAVTSNDSCPDVTDVTLSFNYEGATGSGDSDVLNVTANSGAFDLDLRLNTSADQGAYTDNSYLENFTIDFADANSHSINANGFGDGGNNLSLPQAIAPDLSTSFTVKTAAASGKRIDIDNLDTDTIQVLNAAGTAGTAANVTLRVSNENAYNILTGSGSDIVDLRADNVQADDSTTANIVETDTINLGSGRDTIIVGSNDDLGDNNMDRLFGRYIPGQSTIVDDDVFETMTGVERILIDSREDWLNGSGGEDLDITLDEAAAITGIDTISLVEDYDQTINLVIGNDFTVKTGTDNQNGQVTSALSALVIDASAHTGSTLLNIESKDDDTDIQRVNMDIRVNAESGAIVNLVNTGEAAAEVVISATISDVATTIAASSPISGISGHDGLDDGEIAINTTWTPGGTFDKLVVNGTNTISNQTVNTIFIDNAWTGSTFTVDASAVTNGDADSSTGRFIISTESDGATLNIKGSQNDDSILGGSLADTISGESGNDYIIGMDGADSITGGNGQDTIAGEYIPTTGNNDDFAAVSRVITYDITDLSDGETVTFEVDGYVYSGIYYQDYDSDSGGSGDNDFDGVDSGNFETLLDAFLSGAVSAGKIQSGADGSINTFSQEAYNVNDSSGTVRITFAAGYDLTSLPELTISSGTGSINSSVTTEGSRGHIDLDIALVADTLTGGADTDYFHFSVDKDQNMLTTNVFDTITDLNLGTNDGSGGGDRIGLYEANIAGTAVQYLAINSVLNSGAAIDINTYGPNLVQAINDMFDTGREFGADETNVAALVTYGADTYLVALGSQEQDAFGTDDYIVKVTGVTNGLDVSDFLS